MVQMMQFLHMQGDPFHFLSGMKPLATRRPHQIYQVYVPQCVFKMLMLAIDRMTLKYYTI